ncbi:MAG: glycosyltransferase [Rickettsiales bacterium]|jgi:glycosyltransferase involved in cell wall biosynthesis|nr:glycosyltransferase [Rickettsiales bacterium]
MEKHNDSLTPKISTVLPTYNGAKYLRDSIESVIIQTERNWELIIVNDCSTDNTLKIANEYAEKVVAKILMETVLQVK